MPEVFPVRLKVSDVALLKCGGDFSNLCICNLILAPVLFGRSSDVAVEQSWLLSSSAWIEQQPWPPPHVQVEFEYGSAAIRPSPWPSFLLRNRGAMGSGVISEPLFGHLNLDRTSGVCQLLHFQSF
jgi:hypothetical protein